MGANPFTIPIGTSDPLNLCQGLPLFSLGTARAGVAATSRSYRLIDISATILATRLKISSYASFVYGICGPAIAFLSQNVDVLRTNGGGEGELTLTFNEGLQIEAGMFAGCGAGAGVTLALQVYAPSVWYKPWTLAWQDAFTVNLNFTVDLFVLLRQLILRTAKGSFTQDSQNRLGNVMALETFSLVDANGSSNTVEPDLTATPTIILPINLANYVPPLKAINDGLSRRGGEICVGPALNLEFPVKFNFDHFTVVGGLDGAESADYGNIRYAGNQLSATGETPFNTEVPSEITSHVIYESSFTTALSFHFRITLAKLFNFEVNSRSLGLVPLLFGGGESNQATRIANSVSTAVEGGCVLTPNMTLTFTGPNGAGLNFQTGEGLKGTVELQGYQSSNPATVALAIEPPVAGFPSTAAIAAGSQFAAFHFTFPNECLATGNPNDPSEQAPPGPCRRYGHTR